MNASTEVLVSQSAFDNTTSVLTTCHDDMQDAFDAYKDASIILQSCWAGLAGSKYQTVFEALEKEFEEYNRELASLTEALKQTKESFADFDTSISTTMTAEAL